MRQKRVKSYRKVMQLYCSSFKFREPYQLLVDAEFVEAVIKQKLEFQDRLEDVCQGVVKPMITQCCMQALYDLGPSAQPAVDLAKTFERRMCNHFKVKPQMECLTAMGGKDNVNRYLVATQDLELRKTLRNVAGLPIIYLARSVVLLETPSEKTMVKKLQMETHKLQIPTDELAQLKRSTPTDTTNDNLIIGNLPLASSSNLPSEPEESTLNLKEKKKKVKGPKGPNPLSVKKKTAPVNPNNTTLVPRKPKAIPPTENSKTSKAKRVFTESKEVEREKKRPRVDDVEGLVGTTASRDLVRGGEEAVPKKRKRSRGKKSVGAIDSGETIESVAA